MALEELEEERRAAALKAAFSNHVMLDTSDARLDGQRAAAVKPGLIAHSASELKPEKLDRIPEGTIHIEASDERRCGKMTARMIRDAKRNVGAAAGPAAKLDAFTTETRRLAKAAVDGWLARGHAVEVLTGIASNNNFFDKTSEEIEATIHEALKGAEAEKIANKPWQPPAGADPLGVSAQKQQLILRRASDIVPEKLVWVWRGRIAEGKLVLLGGPPGLGKSQLTAFIAATISTGGNWPCGEGSTAQGSVIIMSAEDGIEDTIVPRLLAAGADNSRVHIVAAVTKPDGKGRKTFSLKTDVALLEMKANEIGNVRLIVVDPISAYMDGADGNGNAETREVLEPLSAMANRLRIAVVGVTHFSKGGGGGKQSALNRFIGSIAYVAAARAAFAIIEDAEDETRRLLLQAKNNLGPPCKGLAFRIEQRLVAGDIPSSNVMFEGEHVSQSIDEALTASETRGGTDKRTGKDDAVDFLRAVLGAGAMPVLEIEQEARAAGLLGAESSISQNKAFRSARSLLGITPQRTGGAGATGKWVWELPTTPKMSSKA
jgi:hypothetical protein